jgi:hypothetical protein
MVSFSLKIGPVCILSLGLLYLPSSAANAGSNDPIEVKLENLKITDSGKTVYVGNSQLHLMLSCNAKLASCITPKKDKTYLLVDETTSWTMPNASTPMSLKSMQDWTVSYNNAKNYGLVAKDHNEEQPLGMFFLDPGNGGYEQDVIIKDGPIVYGTGLGPEDRQRVWSAFFMQMVGMAQKQNANLEGMLARRCMPDASFCTQTVMAQLSGIGGIKEPRNVSIIMATDLTDRNHLLARTICTSPSPEVTVCRDWDTGKLQSADFEKAE